MASPHPPQVNTAQKYLDKNTQPNMQESTDASLSRYLRVEQILKLYPFKRAKLYELMSRKAIRSFQLTEPGARRGIRLVDRLSIDEFLESKAREAGV